jgi:hypothetical protein
MNRRHFIGRTAAALLTATGCAYAATDSRRIVRPPRILLRPGTAIAMLTPGLGNYGLGVAVGGAGDWLSFSHGGANEGYRAVLIAYPRKGDGIVIMTKRRTGERHEQEDPGNPIHWLLVYQPCGVS